MTPYDILQLTGKLPADQIKELLIAAIDVQLAELTLEEATDAANLGHQVWLTRRRERADSIDEGYQHGSVASVSDVELRYDVALAGVTLLDRLRDLAEGRVAAARANLNLLRIRFGVPTSGLMSSTRPATSGKAARQGEPE